MLLSVREEPGNTSTPGSSAATPVNFPKGIRDDLSRMLKRPFCDSVSGILGAVIFCILLPKTKGYENLK